MIVKMMLYIFVCSCTAELAGKTYEIYLKNAKGKRLVLKSIDDDVLVWIKEDDPAAGDKDTYKVNKWKADDDPYGGYDIHAPNNDVKDDGSLKPQFWGVDSKGLYCCDEEGKDDEKSYTPKLNMKDCKNCMPVVHFPNLSKLMDLGILPGLKVCNDVYMPLGKQGSKDDKSIDPEKVAEPGRHNFSKLTNSNFLPKKIKNLFNKKSPDKQKPTEKEDDKQTTDEKVDKDATTQENKTDEDDANVYKIELDEKFLGRNQDGSGLTLYDDNKMLQTKWEIKEIKAGTYQLKQNGLCLGMEQKVKEDKQAPAKLKNCGTILHNIMLKEVQDDDNATKKDKEDSSSSENEDKKTDATKKKPQKTIKNDQKSLKLGPNYNKKGKNQNAQPPGNPNTKNQAQNAKQATNGAMQPQNANKNAKNSVGANQPATAQPKK